MNKWSKIIAASYHMMTVKMTSVTVVDDCLDVVKGININLFYCSYSYGTASASIFTGNFPWNKQWLGHTRQGGGRREIRNSQNKKSKRTENRVLYIIKCHAHNRKIWVWNMLNKHDDNKNAALLLQHVKISSKNKYGSNISSCNRTQSVIWGVDMSGFRLCTVIEAHKIKIVTCLNPGSLLRNFQ